MQRLILQILLVPVVSMVGWSQTLSELYLLDGYSRPYIESDDGISFKYRTEFCGNLSAHIVCSDITYQLFFHKREYFGDGLIHISPKKLTRFCELGGGFTHSCFLTLEILTCRTKKYNIRRLPLSLQIYAPYGCQLSEPPPSPKLSPTNLRKRKVRVEAVLGLLAGISLFIVGIVQEQKNMKDGEVISESRQRNAHTNIAIGGLLSLLSYTWLEKIIPDKEANKRNKIRNQELLSYWESQCESVERKNELIRDTFTIKVRSDDN